MFFRLPIVLVCLVFSMAAFSPRIFATPVSAPIDLESWIYPALDKLDSIARVDSSLQGLKPLTRHEAARRVALAREAAQSPAAPPVAGELLRSLERELQPELAAIDGTAPVRPWTIQPLQDLQLAYVFRDGPPSRILGTNASQFALNTNHAGVDYREQHNLQLAWDSQVRLGDYLLADWRPRIEQQEGEGTRLRTTTGEIAAAAGPITISLGRQSLWWGPGEHGSLILSNNAKALDMLRFTTPSPVTLPWFLSALGPFQFDLFLSRLESDRAVPEPWLSGLRIDFRPTSWLELGASRTIMFGGDGTPDLDLGDFLTILSGKNLSGEDDTSNSLAAVDARLTLPWFRGLQLYGELGGEDEAGNLFSKTAFLAGLYLPQLDPGGRLDLRIEYADTTPPGGDNPVWYRHGLYRSGYTYEKKILGHQAGGDARDLWLETRAFLPGNFSLALNFDFQQRGTTQPLEEKHYQPGLELRWRDAGGREVWFSYAYDHIEHADFTDQSADLHFATLGYVYHW
jgi:hypothetical protein